MLHYKYNNYKYRYFFFSKVVYKFLNKFNKKGNNYKIDFFFEFFLKEMKYKKKLNFLILFLEALSILKPEMGVRILKYAKNKHTKRRKKGFKLPIRTKVIPIIINKLSKYNIAINWLSKKTISSMDRPFSSLHVCLLSTLRYNINSSLKDKKKLRSLIVINRGNLHYRW
jgi:ribosomal protein S7